MCVADLLDTNLSPTLSKQQLLEVLEKKTCRRIHNLELRAGIWWARITGNDAQLSYRWIAVTDLLNSAL